ncbi:hypothetical protein [Paenibacillus sp. KN14-4R]|uniref:hypothetical protein n=1 Tax=Paenibacillus sp. KN14-4R TaxID=3445773 RepID=UPI003FA18FC5
MSKNFMFIGVFITILILIAIILSLVFYKVIIPVCERIGKYIARRVHSKWWLYIFEFSFISMLVALIFATIYFTPLTNANSWKFFVILFLFIMFTIVETTAYIDFRKINKINKSDGIIGWLISLKIWETYILNRTLLFIEQLVNSYFLIVPVFISLLIMTKLDWSNEDFYYSLLLLPVYTNIWVYIKTRRRKFIFQLSFNEYQVIFMRRFIVYLLIIGYTFFEAHNKFIQVLIGKSNMTFEYVFVYSAALIYIAIDRLLKETVSDLEKFKKEKNDKETKMRKEYEESIKQREITRMARLRKNKLK